jgi:hypothetical protein
MDRQFKILDLRRVFASGIFLLAAKHVFFLVNPGRF